MAVECQDGMRAAYFIFLGAQGNWEGSYHNEGRKILKKRKQHYFEENTVIHFELTTQFEPRLTSYYRIAHVIATDDSKFHAMPKNASKILDLLNFEIAMTASYA